MTRSKRRALIGSALVVPLVMAACSSSGSVRTPHGTVSGGLSVNGSPGLSLPAAILSNLPSNLPTNVHTLTTGQATVNLQGGSQANLSMNLGPVAVFAPGTGFAITWMDNKADAFAITARGAVAAGSIPTSSTLIVTLAAASAGTVFASTGGQCSVTLNEATASRVSGSFTCSGVKGSGGQTISAIGTFSATS